MATKYIKMKCQNCGATMDVDRDKEIIFCPYCGSKHLVEEADEVKVERLKTKREGIKAERDKMNNEAKEKQNAYDKSMVMTAIMVAAVMMLMSFIMIMIFR